MIEYMYENLSEKDDPIIIAASKWDKPTLMELRDRKIVFMTSGNTTLPVMVSDNGRLVIGEERDGALFFRRRNGEFLYQIDPLSVESFVADLREAAKICNEKAGTRVEHNAVSSCKQSGRGQTV